MPERDGFGWSALSQRHPKVRQATVSWIDVVFTRDYLVYVARATDSKHGPVAIKYSYPSVIEREEKILLRLKEACVVGIPKIYGTCYWPPFRGITLQLFAQNLATEKMDPEKVVAMGKVMVRGPAHALSLVRANRFQVSTLQAVHNLGIIHHDVKPENIVTSDYQKFCLIDWGAARDKAGSLPEDRIGTPGFMSVRILEGKRESSHPWDLLIDHSQLWCMWFSWRRTRRPRVPLVHHGLPVRPPSTMAVGRAYHNVAVSRPCADEEIFPCRTGGVPRIS